MVALIDGFELDPAKSVARAFTVYFQLVNLAEERHRVRILRERSHSARPVAESLAATVAELTPELGENGVRRLNLATAPMLAALELLRRISQELLGGGSYTTLLGDSVPYPELQALFVRVARAPARPPTASCATKRNYLPVCACPPPAGSIH